MGPKMLRLLLAHWDGQLMIAKEQGFYGPPFGTSRGMTQGSKFSPSAFNIIVDKVVRYWLALVLEDDGGTVVLDGLGLTVRERLPLFYADDGFVGSRDSVAFGYNRRWMFFCLYSVVKDLRPTSGRTSL